MRKNLKFKRDTFYTKYSPVTGIIIIFSAETIS